MDDKKEVTKLLKILVDTATHSTTLSKLDLLTVDAQDPTVKKMAAGLASMLRPYGKGTGKIRLITWADQLKQAQTGPDHKKLAAALLACQHYCDTCLASVVPQWQISARAAGWTPPP